jgi:hypothetical protein
MSPVDVFLNSPSSDFMEFPIVSFDGSANTGVPYSRSFKSFSTMSRKNTAESKRNLSSSVSTGSLDSSSIWAASLVYLDVIRVVEEE